MKITITNLPEIGGDEQTCIGVDLLTTLYKAHNINVNDIRVEWSDE